jgi:hypothetical protein
MKLKCGNCGNIIDTDKDEQKPLDEEHIGFICTSCKKINKLAKARLLPEKNDTPTKVIDSLKPAQQIFHPDMAPGWIFVHDENTPKQSFDLKTGKNIIGRKSSVSVDIPIDTTDDYMSRRHCIIEVVKKLEGNYDFLLSDYKALNGTFINGIAKKRLKTEDIILLNDGDTVQLGMTKMVFRVNKNVTRDHAQAEVNNSSYARTVIVARK